MNNLKNLLNLQAKFLKERNIEQLNIINKQLYEIREKARALKNKLKEENQDKIYNTKALEFCRNHNTL